MSTDLQPPHGIDCPPAYSQTLKLEIILSQSRIITRGHRAPFRVMLHIPRELLCDEGIFVRSLATRLCSFITGTFGHETRSAVQLRHFSSVQGLVRPDREHFELDVGAWAPLLLLNTEPTCDTCALKIDHSIETTVELTKGMNGQGQVSRGPPRHGEKLEPNLTVLSVIASFVGYCRNGRPAGLRPIAGSYYPVLMNSFVSSLTSVRKVSFDGVGYLGGLYENSYTMKINLAQEGKDAESRLGLEESSIFGRNG